MGRRLPEASSPVTTSLRPLTATFSSDAREWHGYEDRIRRRARRLVSLALAGATVGVGTGAMALQEDNRTQTAAGADRSITVTGRASAEGPLDEAVVTVAAVAEGEDPAAVREALATNADALRQSLRDAGVADEQVATVEFRIDEPDRPPDEPHESPDGRDADYRGVHAFRITVDDVARTGAVVDAAANAGAEVRYVVFGLSDERRAELRDRALDDARRQTDTLAAAGGLEATEVRRVDASDGRFDPVYGDGRLAEEDGGGETVFSPDDVTVHVDLRATYDAEVADGENES